MAAGSRVRSVVARANSKLSISWAAALLSGSMLLSSLLGLYRQRLLNGLYYDTYKVGLDAYTVAFMIPDFMFFILVSGALSVTFIPVFNKRLMAGNKKSAWELSSSMVNFMALLTLAASILIMIFANWLVRLISPGLDESGHALAVSMMRVIAVNPFLFAVATVISSMQQAVGRFTFYALAPTIYNIGIIIGALFFTGGIRIGNWVLFDGGIMGVALGVVLGAIMQLIVSSIGLLGLGFDYRMKIHWKNKGFRKVLSLLPARSLDQGIDYINGFVETNLASRMSNGTITAYHQASTLALMPVNLIGVAIGNAAFSRMTELLAEEKREAFKKQLRTLVRIIVWLALPVAVVTFFGRGYVVNFIKRGGDPLMAGLLGALVIMILFRTVYHIAARTFYAQQDTKTPLYISIFSIVLNIVLAITFISFLDTGVYGLAWAQSLVAVIEVAILFAIMAKRIPGLFNRVFVSAILRMASAAGFMAIITYICVSILQLQTDDESFLATFPKFAVITIVSFTAYVGICRLMKIREADPVINQVRKVLFGSVRRHESRR